MIFNLCKIVHNNSSIINTTLTIKKYKEEEKCNRNFTSGACSSLPPSPFSSSSSFSFSFVYLKRVLREVRKLWPFSLIYTSHVLYPLVSPLCFSKFFILTTWFMQAMCYPWGQPLFYHSFNPSKPFFSSFIYLFCFG